MKRKIALVLSILLFAAPVLAAADSGAGNTQLTLLYTQLINLLQQELALLQNPTTPSLSIMPAYGAAPLPVIFTLSNPTGTEAIDYGDGHSSGSNGCLRNAQNWCDLSQSVAHTYQYPGTYKVTLYGHPSSTLVQVLSTATVVVTKP